MKLSLLVYRVSWLIERKKIYSLITKCSILNKYILASLVHFLESFRNVAQRHRLMREPILSRGTSIDSLDAMLEMNLESILEHPIVVEVLNLVYEGQYSIDSSSLSLSTTFFTFSSMDSFDYKSILKRLTMNLQNISRKKQDSKQSSVQYHIWKNCIKQRHFDEQFFVALAAFVIYALIAYASHNIQQVQSKFQKVFGKDLIIHTAALEALQPHSEDMGPVCGETMPLLENVASALTGHLWLVWIISVSTMTTLVQTGVTVLIKNNVDLDPRHLFLEVLIFLAGGAFIWKTSALERKDLLTPLCEGRAAFSLQ